MSDAPKRTPAEKFILVTKDNERVDSKSLDKQSRDLITRVFGNGVVPVEYHTFADGKRVKNAKVIEYDPADPLKGNALLPGEDSPICQRCGLYQNGCERPFMKPQGPAKPVATVVYESVHRKEDESGRMGRYGYQKTIMDVIEGYFDETKIGPENVRWVPLTRCFSKTTIPNYKTAGRWCRLHLIQDLMFHPPKVIIPVGTAVLGLLSHKSNAGDWSGKRLVWRGWPDDWLTDPSFVDPREFPAGSGKKLVGHPIFGPPPDESKRIPVVPLQHPRLVLGTGSAAAKIEWATHLKNAMDVANDTSGPLVFNKPWYRFTENIEEIEAGLDEIIRHPGMLVCYDTETTGLKGWSKKAAIVSIMFRWADPETNAPRSLGFPWDFDKSPVYEARDRLKPRVWKALTGSTLVGHNLTFDMLYTYATFWKKELTGWDDPKVNRRRDARLVALADACAYDTWHMAFVMKQKRGSLGLEVLAYDYAKDLAGYEEDMTLLIERNYDTMHPEGGQGGHYVNCPRELWDSHLVPYVMGDVEVAYKSYEALRYRLDRAPTHGFPLADPARPGKLRLYDPPSRQWVYDRIMSPASRMLMKLMARGMFISDKAVVEQEEKMPRVISAQREAFSLIDPRITNWCEEQSKIEHPKLKGPWALDLENKTHLKTILLEKMELPVQRLTKTGRDLYGEEPENWDKRIRAAIRATMPSAPKETLDAAVRAEFHRIAAVDKFTLNRMAVDHPEIRPLLDYRKTFKLYSTYVKPLRNSYFDKVDKKHRTDEPHLSFDSCIHASFMLTGTRGGRLSCREPNLQQLPRDGEVKSLYVSRFGARGCMYQSDLSQIELRLLAAACGDPTMVKAYFDDIDLHSLTTSRIFKVPYENFSKDFMKHLQTQGKTKEAKDLDTKRNIGKTVNFLTGYGGGAFGLQNVLAAKAIYLPIEECQSIIESFFDSYPSLRQLLQHYKRFILESSRAVSIFGRVRIFEEVGGSDEEAIAKAQRAGCNHLIQSTASDMMLIALCVIEELMREENLESLLVSTVHDSLLIDCVKDELPKVHEIVMTVLNNFPDVLPAFLGDGFDTSWMLVPFAGDSEVGPDYLNMVKVPKGAPDWDELLSEA